MGRPPLPPGQRQDQRIELRLSREHAALFRAIGGVQWLRSKLDAAKAQ